jgi:putative Mn2+ efflux pump MntP
MGRLGATFRKAWEKPPRPFHRRIATHRGSWVAVVVGILLVGMARTMVESDAVEILIGLATLALAALAAWVGATLTKRKVNQYDYRAGA